MSEEKKELKNELKKNECCKGKEKLSIEELDKVNGGAGIRCIAKTAVGGDEEPILRKVE